MGLERLYASSQSWQCLLATRWLRGRISRTNQSSATLARPINRFELSYEGGIIANPDPTPYIRVLATAERSFTVRST